MSLERIDKIGEFFLNTIEESYTLRNQQKNAQKWFTDKIIDKKKFFIMEMPTGTGKSLTSQLIIKHYIDEINREAKINMLTCTKNLQEQYIKEFKYLHNLWGKANYVCDFHNTTCDHGQILDKQTGHQCDSCPHKEALKYWLGGRISLSNFHTYSLYELFNPSIFDERAQNLLIVDEAHLFEPTMAGFVSYTLSKKHWDKFVGVKKSTEWALKVFSYKNVQEIINFLKTDYMSVLEKTIKDKKRGNINKETGKLISELENTKNTITKIIDEHSFDPVNWIADKKVINDEPAWEIQPLWIHKIMKKHIWNRYDHIVLLSGTILNPELFCKVNGIDPKDAVFFKMDSPFPVENRKIFYMPLGKMTFTEKENTWAKYVPYIKKILKKYKGKKGIIHTGNYEILEKIREEIDDERLIFVMPNNRQDAINQHIRSKKDTILVSASLMTGIDLKDDLSRFQLILKMPYPSLGSKLNKIRSSESPEWYKYATVLDLIQGYGRSIRSVDDYADTIIFDECFSNVVTSCIDIIPKYFVDAIQEIKIN